MKLHFQVLLGLILMFDMAHAAVAQGIVMDFIVDGKQRQSVIFAPTTDMMVKRPLVFAFHAHGGNMQKASKLMHIHTVWPEAIVVYPQGVRHRPSPVDPQGNNFGWEVEANACRLTGQSSRLIDQVPIICELVMSFENVGSDMNLGKISANHQGICVSKFAPKESRKPVGAPPIVFVIPS